MAYVSTETTKRVRGELKQAYPNLKFSVSKKDGTLRVRIMSGDIDFRDVWEDIPQSKQYWKRFNYPKPHFEGYVDINTYHPDSYNPKYTDLFKGIIDIMKGNEWFDKSDPQIDYFNTAYYMKLSVGKWNKDYQYTGVPRMSDLFGRMRAEELEAETKMHPDWCSNCGMKDDGCINLGYGDWYCMNFLNNRETYDGRYDKFRGEAFEAQLSEYLYKCDACGHITDVRFSDVYSDKYCRDACARGRPEKCRGSCGKNGWDVEFTGVYHAGLSQRPSIDTKYGVNISCKDCGIGFYGDARWELYDELPDKSQAEDLGAEGEDINLLNTYFDEEVYRLSPDIYAEVYDRIDYNSKQLGNNPSYQDRLKQFQSRVRRIDENIYQRAMETAQMRIAKEEEDFDAEGEENAIGYCGVCNSPYDFNGVEETCGVMCRNCPKELTDGPNWKLSVVKNPLHANYEFDNMRGESGMCYYGINCQKCDNEPVAIIAWEESWDEPDYFCSSCWNNMEGDETEFYERIAIQPSKRNNIKNKNLIAKKLLNAEGEVECYDCQKSFDLSETKTWIDDERYCADCLDFQRKQALKDDEALQREEENERIVRAIRRDRGDEYYAEGEDMSLKDSAKLGFGLGAGLLGFRVALFGASALVGGFILNRNK